MYLTNTDDQKSKISLVNTMLSDISKMIDSKKHDSVTSKSIIMSYIRSVSDFLIEEESRAKSELQ